MLQFIDLQAQFRDIQYDVEAAVLKVLRGGQYIMGPEVAELEGQLVRFTGAPHCISCATGTDALVMALMAKGIGPGDAVFTPPFTFVATAEAIATVGATPVFVDVDQVSFNLDADRLALAIEALRRRDGSIHPLPLGPDGRPAGLQPRGVIAVDLFGLPADYERINALAHRSGLFVIEDAAQSFGARSGNSRAGALADIGCTSFFPAKPLGCYGDGGAIFVDDDGLADVLRSIRVHGQGSEKYDNVRLGITGRLDTVQAAVLLVKLKRLENEIEARQRVAAAYGSAIRAAGLPLVTPEVPAGMVSAWAQYSVLARSRAERTAMMQVLKAAGIPTMIYYPKPLHLQPAFAGLGHKEGDFPVSGDLASRVFSLPMHPYLDEATIGRVVDGLGG